VLLIPPIHSQKRVGYDALWCEITKIALDYK